MRVCASKVERWRCRARTGILQCTSNVSVWAMTLRRSIMGGKTAMIHPASNATTVSFRSGVIDAAHLATTPQTAAELLPLVYEQLRRLARQKLGAEPPGQTLQATSLVHEAYMRLVRTQASRCWDSQWHFFVAAAESMRRILIEHARGRRRLKRGGGWQRIDLAEVAALVDDGTIDVLVIDEALERLAGEHREKAELVRLRYFVGLSTAEAAAAMGTSVATAERYWSFAKAWLLRHMSGGTGGEDVEGGAPHH